MPRTASVWYYFRETDYPHIKELWEIGDKIAQGAAMMTDTELLPTRVLGTAWPQHFNKTIAEDDVGEHQAGRPAEVERRRPDAGEGAAEGAGSRETGTDADGAEGAARPGAPTIAAAAPTTSATSRGTCRP